MKAFGASYNSLWVAACAIRETEKMTMYWLPHLLNRFLLTVSFSFVLHILPCHALSMHYGRIHSNSSTQTKGGFRLSGIEPQASAIDSSSSGRVFSDSLPSGRVLVLVNDCFESESHKHSRYHSDQQDATSCHLILKHINPHGRRKQTQIKLLDANEFPELRGIAVSGEEGAKGLERVYVSFWSATCPTKTKPCSCNKQDGCAISFTRESKPSCLAPVYGGELAAAGTRLCQGTELFHGSNKNGCYYYALEVADGWECGDTSEDPGAHKTNPVPAMRIGSTDSSTWQFTGMGSWSRHGVGLGSSRSVRYGTIFLAEFDGHGKLLWVKPLAENATAGYGKEHYAALVKGEVLTPRGEVEKQYAVTVTRETWEEKDGSPLVYPHCEILLVDRKGEKVEGMDIPGRECEGCLSLSAAVHPETSTWGVLCVSARLPLLGIHINGQLAVNSTERYKHELEHAESFKGKHFSHALDKTKLYHKDTEGRLLPVIGGHWVLIWRESSWGFSKIDGLRATTATLKAALWELNQHSVGALGPAVSLFGPKVELELRHPDVVSLTLDTAVVTVVNCLREEATARAVNLSQLSRLYEASEEDNFVAAGSALLSKQLYSHWLPCATGDEALQLPSPEKNLPYVVDGLVLSHDRTIHEILRMVSFTKREDGKVCEGRWEAESSICPSSCLQKQTFRSSNSSFHLCPWEADAFRLAYCEGGDCPDWREGASLFVMDARLDAAPLLDRDLETMILLNQSRSSLTLRLKQPIDLEEIEVFLQPANVSMQLIILDMEGNWLSAFSISIKSSNSLNSLPATEIWAKRDLSLRRVSTFELKAASNRRGISTTTDQWFLGILELRLRAIPSPPCSGGGFDTEEEGCKELQGTSDTLESLDCHGEWGEWSLCEANCTRRRIFRTLKPPAKGGKPCISSIIEPCTGAQVTPLQQSVQSNASSDALSGGGLCDRSHGPSRQPTGMTQWQPFLRSQLHNLNSQEVESSNIDANCLSFLTPKTQCVSCRTMQTLQVTQQAKGQGVPCPTEPFVLDYCDANCAAIFGSTSTTTASIAVLTVPADEPFLFKTEIDLEDSKDVMALLKTLAIYLVVTILACVFTVLMVGILPTGTTAIGRTSKALAGFCGKPEVLFSKVSTANSCSTSQSSGSASIERLAAQRDVCMNEKPYITAAASATSASKLMQPGFNSTLQSDLSSRELKNSIASKKVRSALDERPLSSKEPPSHCFPESPTTMAVFNV